MPLAVVPDPERVISTLNLTLALTACCSQQKPIYQITKRNPDGIVRLSKTEV